MTDSIDQLASTFAESFKTRLEKALERTRELREAEKPEPKSKHSKKARDLRRILDSADFGCQERAVEKLVETLASETLPKSSRRKGKVDPDTVRGAVVVPTDNRCFHDYTLGVPVMCDPDGEWYAMSRVDRGGLPGNFLVRDISCGNFRFATDAEVAAYFRALATGEWEPPAEDDAAEAAR